MDRTQPNRLRKSLFEGEWYLQKTTFDVPYSAGFTFTGETSLLERVRWEIQEMYLIAYRTYEVVDNTLAPNTLPDVQLRGAPVAAYAIESHFDVTREYNALTGEETNVITENAMDRPWYERDYVRVNWSKNLVASFAFLDDQVAQSPMDYFVQDRDDADRLLIGVKDGDFWVDHQDWEEIAKLERADYIDIVDTLFASPEEIEFYDEWDELVAYPACWFYAAKDCQPARIKVRSSFMKVPPTSPYEVLPYPDNEIARNADGTAMRDANGEKVRIPWFDKFGYFRIERDYYDRDRERTESGRTYLINRWNIWADTPTCKDGDSYAACTVKPIVYYLSPGFPEARRATAERVVSEWNLAFKEVVNQLKYGGQQPLDQVEDVVRLANNTYEPNGARGQRIGDLRYSFIYYVPEPLSVGPLGYGPSAADPLTGEIIQATAYVYGAGLESWAAWGADTVQLLNGAVATDDFIDGEDVRQYVTQARARAARTSSERVAHGHSRVERAKQLVRSEQVQKGRTKQRQLGKRGMRLDRSKLRAKLSAIQGTPFEQALLNDELVRALKPSTRGTGSGLSASLSPRDLARMSPARWGTRGAMKALNEKRRLKMRKSNLYLAAFADDGVMGLAESLVGQDWNTVRNTIVDAVFASTTEHELGHTFGLRHNFAGSFDALNYHPQYWTQRGDVPEPFMDETAEQVTGRMREYQYASIMDYGARFNSDIHGLGRYDSAAIMFGYGQRVEVFDSPPVDPLFEVVGHELALHELRHYTKYPRLFGGSAANMQRRHYVPYREIVAQMTGQASSSMVEVPYRFCSDEYESAYPGCNAWDEGADAWEVVSNAAQAYESYYFFNSFSRDLREIEPWDHLDRIYYRYFLFGQLQYQDWVFRSFDYEYLWDELREDWRTYQIENASFDQAVDGNLPGALASQTALDLLARVIQTPEPGAYYHDPDDDVFYNYAYDTDIPLCPPGRPAPDCSDLNVDLGPGKYAFSLFDADSGYYFFERVKVVGSFYDKLAALQTLTSPETYFLGVDADADITAYAISMHLFFPDQVTRLVGGSALELYHGFAGIAENGQMVNRDMFAPQSNYDGMPVVDPATSFTVELYSAWLGMAFLNANFDNTFNDLMRVFEEGSGDGFIPQVEDPARIARFVHPRTGRTLMAIRHEDPNRFSPAYELVMKTQDLVERIEDPDLRAYYVETAIALMDNLRGLHEIYGKLVF